MRSDRHLRYVVVRQLEDGGWRPWHAFQSFLAAKNAALTGPATKHCVQTAVWDRRTETVVWPEQTPSAEGSA